MLARVGALGAALMLAACGSGQNWQDGKAYVKVGGSVTGLNGTLVLQNNGQDNLSLKSNGSFNFALQIASGAAYAATILTQPTGQLCTVTAGTGHATGDVSSIVVTCQSNPTIGGTVSGLTGGTVVLQNNGSNSLATATNGAFTFTTAVAPGAAYAVTVLTQPAGETCTVTHGSGSANANVTDVAVACSAFTLRPLPAIYSTGKAISYSAYRAGGPGAGEVPSNQNILDDLALLHAAGFNLLRLFGSDVVSEKILTLAAAYPEMKFQLGIYLEGAPASCVDSLNSAQITKGIALANSHANVATVSVGNETSFANNLPVSCLVSYIQTVRSQVTQPVTADDDYSFYAGISGNGEKPDTVLPQLDFVSIHIYPFSNYPLWDWQQTGTAAGPARAGAMMAAALTWAKGAYAPVAAYLYKDASGATVSVGATLPIVIGESGWKAVQTNPSSAIEAYAALPVNAKWYYDLLGTWGGTAGGPRTIIYFEAFDEAWKGTDDGWGLWDRNRVARYGLCGTAAGTACNVDLYAGAGYHP
jgi:exo-beta-1,3-glucanase (GH17 family)